MTLRSLVFVMFLSLFFCSCNRPDGHNVIKIQKASLQHSEQKIQTQVAHYDFDKTEKRLVKKLETTNEPNPNILEIAVQNFLTKTNFRGKYENLKLDYTDFSTNTITAYFSGDYGFERNEDEEIFQKALELTITAYTEKTNIKLVFIK